MKSIYSMTKDDNIFFAKRKLIDNLYRSANLEGIAVTFADIVAFVNNLNNGKLSVDEMLKLKGLKLVSLEILGLELLEHLIDPNFLVNVIMKKN